MARNATGRKAPSRQVAAKPSTGKAAAKTPARPAMVKKAGRKTVAKKPRKQAAAKNVPAKRKAASVKAALTTVKKAAPARKARVRKVTANRVKPARKASATAANITMGRKVAQQTVATRKSAAPKTASRKAPLRQPETTKASQRKATAQKVTAPKLATRTARAVIPMKRKTAAPTRRTASPRLQTANGRQCFTVSHLHEDDFKRDGLRPYALYRELGIASATNGLCQAHVIRLIPPCTDEVRVRHTHQAELQLVYVLKGWMKNEFEGHGEQMMSAGSCWLQPPGIKHTVLDYSADLEVLEIIVPADFKTIEVD